VANTQSDVGKPDILVCNAAGEAPIGALEKVEASVFDEAMISEVRNNLLLVNLVAPDMVARRDGSIIMSSIVGSRGRSGVGVYATTKAAVTSWSAPWQSSGDRSKSGRMQSPRPLSEPIFPASSGTLLTPLARATARVPMGRIGEADDVAGLALLLASPAGSFMNGQIIGVDGGASAW
jgi:NAD(P)-dependent dehydrogenase (short-subunit alcohol dehydrogenase family)